jgi:hypothetical protein
VFHEACLHTGKIFALLDGVDEISPDYTKKVFNLINALLEMKIKKLYISSRPEIAKDLETKYNEISYNLVPIPAADQWEYLMYYWKKHSSLKDEEILSRLAEKSIEKFKGSLITYIENDNLVVRYMTVDETITSIPLFLNLVAEIINDPQGKIIDSRNSKNKTHLSSFKNYLSLWSSFEFYIKIF